MHDETKTTSTGQPIRGRRPRIGFIGVGHIGRDRLQLLVEEDLAEAAVLYDPDPTARDAAAKIAPQATCTDSLEQALDADLDGVVVSSPNTFHCDQATRALRAGIPVFCQKPVGCNPSEAGKVLTAAQEAGLPFGVDLPYRHSRGLERAREAVATGEIGDLFGLELTFHNGYGPQQPWFYDVSRSGGGCLLDLGVHLMDLAVWLSGSTAPRLIDAALWKKGRRVQDATTEAEDFAALTLDLDDVHARLACSRDASLGQDARFELVLHGTKGAVRVHNADGSFYRLKTEVHRKTQVLETLVEQTHWRGRALHAWTRDLQKETPFDTRILRLLDVVETIHAARDTCRRRDAPSGPSRGRSGAADAGVDLPRAEDRFMGALRS